MQIRSQICTNTVNVILMGWVMQEPVYSLNYFLERMDLMRSWVDIEVEKV